MFKKVQVSNVPNLDDPEAQDVVQQEELSPRQAEGKPDRNVELPEELKET